MHDLLDDADATAQLALKEAALDGDDRPCPIEVARRLDVPVMHAPRDAMPRMLAARIVLRGQQQIWVRKGLPLDLEQFAVAHELGHVCVRRWSLHVDEHEEEWCNVFAGALLLPRDVVRRLWSVAPLKTPDAPLLPGYAHVPPTCIALRIGETRLADVWITDGEHVRYARAERDVAIVPKLGARAARDGVARKGPIYARRLSDGRHRAAVVLDGAA